MAKNMNEISDIMKRIRFKKKWFGGVDEADVWRIMGKLQKEYEELLSVELAKQEAILTQGKTVSNAVKSDDIQKVYLDEE